MRQLRATCSQVSLQQEEEEVEEFQLVEKLQQLGINQGDPSQHLSLLWHRMPVTSCVWTIAHQIM